MNLRPAGLHGSFLIDIARIADDRGYFARIWDDEWSEALGVEVRNVQTNLSTNLYRGTIRGPHWQEPPHGEAKLLRCTRGSVFDVAVDVRPDSPTYGQWQGHVIDAESKTMIFVPVGTAHGYQALEDGAEVSYQCSSAYTPSVEHGVRWDDPTVGIKWPVIEGAIVSDKDRSWPDVFPEAGR